MKDVKNVRLLFDITNRASNVLMDTETGVVFTKQDPLKTVPYVSKSAMRAIRYGKLIDVDGVLDVNLPPRIKVLHQRILNSLNIVPVPHETEMAQENEETKEEPKVEAPKKKTASNKKTKDKEVEVTEE